MKRTAVTTTLMLVAGAIILVACTQDRISATRSANYVVEGGVARGKVWHDNRSYAHKVKIESLYEDGIHDPNNAAISALQNPSEALSSFPYDRRGGIDWVKALDLGIINPRADLKGKNEMMTMDMDILFKDTGHMPWVKFPHIAHTKWLDCSNCHPKIFIPQKGANNPSMDGILAGEYCGRCHDKVAFPLWICERCHSVPHKNSPKQWWGNHKDDRFSGVKHQKTANQTTAK
ncbi:MAG: cytochrome c3 family protein [Gammaproteobacteria bacterium]|jgi:c(7)-type cytochrome triheme protein